MRVRNALGAMGTIALLALASVASSAAEVSDKRLKEIYAMSPEQMAMTGAWTRSNMDRLATHLNSINDPKIRALVLDMVYSPKSTVFNATAQKNAFRTMPAAGGPGHHYYPGGLAVHAVENIEIAFGWADMFARVHGVTLNRDIVIAALTFHDWAKVWYEWDSATGGIKRPAWFPAYWGGEQGIAKWKWMGGHGAIVYAELLKRGAPIDLVIATASSHFDPFWDVDKADSKEGLNAALAEAAKLAGVPAPKIDPAKRMAEWWLSVFSDGSWSFSHYIAGQFSHNWIREVAKDLGIDPKSPEANKLAWFVLTRISDFKLYSLYQNSGYSADAVKKVILSVLKDSTAYEVPAS
ncbi:MAG: hypothetical protein IT564_10850 [Rhodospirillales bacterium]|nr:hypothetical protein [Rhodospirillales bacterium]